MRWLKALVIGMGVAIVIGMAVVIIEVARRANAPVQPTTDGASSPAFGDVRVQIPAGASVVETLPGRDRLTVRLRLPDGRAALLIIDTATGEKVGMITLDGRPATP